VSVRKVCVVTGTRAEYGQLSPLLRALQDATDFSLDLVVTGAHLAPEFGRTVDVIRADGFEPACEVEMLLSSDTRAGTARSMGLAVMGLTDALARLDPDVLMVLGDRYEILAAVQSAEILGIPIAHIHGGEVTSGAFDDAIRHAITKFASLHFVAAELYRRRVIQMGEHPSTVHTVGAPALDAIRELELISRAELEQDLGLELASPVLLATYHPPTAIEGPDRGLGGILAALDRFPEATVIWTYPNADTGSRNLIKRVIEWVDVNKGRARVVRSLGALRYLSLLNCADGLLGNSSSGLTEAPFLRTPTINVGDRQAGRLRSSTVIDVGEDANEVEAGLRRVLDPSFKGVVAASVPLYGDGRAVERIMQVLRSFDGSRHAFFDIAHEF
jgi:UDP-hydrolysing UDP-N-acetyl-D-glucosamine 2-epimerase